MDEATQDSILAMVVREWQAVSGQSQPWGVWVRRYPPLPIGKDTLDASGFPEGAWFLDAGIIRERSVWEWRRFWAVQCDQPWCNRAFLPEPNALFGEPHKIGLAAFARYAGSDAYYLEVIWGGRCGCGWKLGASEEGQVYQSKYLWIS